MPDKDVIMIRQKELKRLHVIQKVEDRELTQVEAAEILSISDRQVRRLLKRIKYEGDRGAVHRLRGKQSSKKFPKELKDKVLELYMSRYYGFGSTFAVEKLKELEGIKVSKETLSKWLIEKGQYQQRKRKAHRQWRERKGHTG
ncbi:transposase [Candidatus Magnetobacterium bavaricum]|uniref:Transposase n=1 Tax=Candidatus Magnetobacterium bavaricum TaxID=29290 RepID=A0A0F3GPR2_9BACT|nr:transposase [Candidatus Magnetobacterium bavaricum]